MPTSMHISPTTPITAETFDAWFPAMPSPDSGDAPSYEQHPYWRLQQAGRDLAQLIGDRVTDPGHQEQAWLELRRALDCALETIPAPPDAPHRALLAPFGPSTWPVVRSMLALAQPTPADVLYDLGSGDGRVVHTAAQDYGCRAVGIEIDPLLVAQSRERISSLPPWCRDRMTFRCADVLDAEWSEATVVTMFLNESAFWRLSSRLRALPRGTRVVSHGYVGDWQPDRTVVVDDHRIFAWTVR